MDFQYQLSQIASRIDQVDIFVDIGPGECNTEAYYIHKIWPHTKIIGFEPCKARYDSLTDYPGILLPLSVSEQVGNISAYQGENAYRQFSIYVRNGEEQFYNLESALTISLDYMFGNNFSMFVWADTEGSELKIIKGAHRLLSNGQIKGMNLEVWQTEETPEWPQAAEITAALEPYGLKHVYGKFAPEDTATDFIYKLG